MTRDYHIHPRPNRCASPLMTVPSVLQRAREAGLTEIGLVLHHHPGDDPAAFDALRAEIEAYKGLFPGRVLLGVEIDILDDEGNTSYAEGLDGKVDYVMLAMGHTQLPWVRPKLTGNPEDFLIRQTTSLLRAIDGVPATLLAHPFIYGSLHKTHPGLAHSLRPDRLPLELVRELTSRLVDEAIIFEYHCRDLLIRPQNLGGEAFLRSYEVFLGMLRDHGVRFVAGSDAHYPDQIGRSAHAPGWAQNKLPALPQEANV